MELKEVEIGDGSLIIIVSIFVQPLESVIVEIYVPAGTFVKFWDVAPLFQLKEYGDVPP